DSEGPGTIEDFLRARNIAYSIVEMATGDVANPADYDTLVMMGGPMSVNESDIYAYIEKEEKLVRDFTADGKRVIGVCLGAQIMAKALGSTVYRGAQKEIGWYDINITEEGLADERIRRLAMHPHTGDIERKFKVFHWHGETFDIPDAAVRLASSALFPNQAFRYGKNAFAFQFHIEVQKNMVFEWLKNEGVNFEKINTETEALYDVYTARAHNFYESFFE